MLYLSTVDFVRPLHTFGVAMAIKRLPEVFSKVDFLFLSVLGIPQATRPGL